MINARIEIISDYANDLFELIRAFEPYFVIDDKSNDYLFFKTNSFTNEFTVSVSSNLINNESKSLSIQFEKSLDYKRNTKRFAKVFLYGILKKITGEKLPYGCLTGIRPTKLLRECSARGEDTEYLFSEVFEVSKSKFYLINSIVNNQKGIYTIDDNQVDLFVNIPFCPTRCSYCSFVSVAIDKLSNYIEYYIKYLKREISILKNVILHNNYTVRSVYIGGGTPTSLAVKQLAEIVNCVNDTGAKEFTVEAGRPDTFSEEMLKMLKDGGVTRISVNPQTLNNKTLELIGRKHTAEDFYRAYEIAQNFNFDINVDLIAALPEETLEDFKRSLDGVFSLSPQNITVHTLALKRGSVLTVGGYNNEFSSFAEAMTDYAREKLSNVYFPYYMYRQKYMSGNLENTGYAKKNKACIYNVDIMEESTSILAAGAGSVSKRVFSKANRIERQADFKGVKEYIERFSEIEDKTAAFWK